MPRVLAILILGLVFWSPAYAATVQVDATGGIAEKIFNLDIGGAFYDVVFEHVDGDVDPYSSFVPCAPDDSVPCDVFSNDETGAIAASEAIKQFFNAYNAQSGTAIDRVGTVLTSDVNFFVPYQIGQGCNDFCARRQRFKISTWFHEDAPDIADNVVTEFARFQPATAPVPLPPAVYMFLSGIAIFGWFRRRRG